MSTMPNPTGESDTPADIIAMRDALLLRQTTVERANQLRALNRTVELLAREGIRKRNPGISEAGLFREMADLRLGADLAARVYGASADAR